MYSLPTILYLFIVILFFDVIRLILRLSGRFSFQWAGFAAVGTGIALGITLLVMIFGYWNAGYIHTTHYNVALNKSGPGKEAYIVNAMPSAQVVSETLQGVGPVYENHSGRLRIVLVSDLHIGTTVNRKWLAKIVDAANKAKPDVIVLAGDIFDNNIDTIPNRDAILDELRRFNATLGVYACQGNHDVDRISFRNDATMDRIQEFLKKADITLLLDEVEYVADSFYLVGRRDARPIGMGQGRKSAADLSTHVDTSKPIIFLDHQPTDFWNIEEAGADLILSGHTHAGQFFPGNIVTSHIYRRTGAVHYGYWKGGSAQAVITSGAGVWGPPIRILTRSEVAIVDISFK